MVYGPKLFSLIERVGRTRWSRPTASSAGDSFGNGHFLTSGGAMTGMIGHSWRVLEYWQARDAGAPQRGDPHARRTGSRKTRAAGST